MSLTKEQKDKIIKEFGTNEKDTGSPEVQIALLTARIEQLQNHFKTHKKDKHSKLGFIKIVGQRRKKLNYLKAEHPARYEAIIKKLGIRK